MKEVTLKGIHRIEVRDDKGEADVAELEIRYARIRVLPPIGKQKRYPALDLVVSHASERGVPRNRKPINWKLLTDSQDNVSSCYPIPRSNRPWDTRCCPVY